MGFSMRKVGRTPLFSTIAINITGLTQRFTKGADDEHIKSICKTDRTGPTPGRAIICVNEL
tara:strand:- start:716 stop:898 length:183 start_codon:yes stop_codon:yes gene_type:complete